MTQAASKTMYGFIGLGAIGAPMAWRLVDAGLNPVVWNRTASRAAEFAEKDVQVAESPADLAARCDIVSLCLLSPDAIEEVLFGPEGIVQAPDRPSLIVDHSTVHPQRTREIAGRLRAEAGIAWLDAPVSGGPEGASKGTLAAMAGGDAEDFERALPVLRAFADQITHVGELGLGQLAKATNQVIGFINAAALAEGMNFAAAAGLDARKLPAMLAGGFADSQLMREYGKAVEAGEASGLFKLIEAYAGIYGGKVDTAFAGKLGLLRKDVSIVSDIARSSGAPLPMFSQVETLARMLDKAHQE